MHKTNFQTLTHLPLLLEKGVLEKKKKKKKGVHLAIIATAINKFKSKIILAQVGPILKKWLI